MDGGEEARRRLVVTGGHGAEALEGVEAALDAVTQGVEPAVEPELDAGVRRVELDDRLHPARPDGVDDRLRGVAGVADERLALGVGNEFFGLDGFVPVALRQRDVERLPLRRGDRVDLGRNASSRTPKMISSDPPFPPAASWWARTMVASTREPASSTSMASSLKSRSQTPRFAQRANRL